MCNADVQVDPTCLAEEKAKGGLFEERQDERENKAGMQRDDGQLPGVRHLGPPQVASDVPRKFSHPTSPEPRIRLCIEHQQRNRNREESRHREPAWVHQRHDPACKPARSPFHSFHGMLWPRHGEPKVKMHSVL